MAEDTAPHIIVKEQRHALVLPPTFAAREEVVIGLSEAVTEMQHRRALAAAILLCTPSLLKLSALDFTKAKYNIQVFGHAAYGWLHDQGVTLDEVVDVGSAAVKLCRAALYPSATEENAAAGFTSPPAAG
jgi:hypothetical protein